MLNNEQADLSYREIVALRYQLYSSLFTTLPYGDLETMGNQLALFSQEAKGLLSSGESPISLVDRFLASTESSEKWEQLFRFLQIIERDVVLFDAIEDAAFPQLHKSSDTGTMKSLLKRVIAEDVQDEYVQHLQNYSVRIVLTAHPTQFYPDPVLGIIRELITALRDDNLDTIRSLLLQLGRTRFRNREKPTPLMEAHSVLWYLEHNFYSVLPTIWRQALNASPSELDPDQLRSLLEIGFWPGGDRDGNPFVTASVTREVATALKTSILTRYLHDARLLKQRLTFDGVFEELNRIIATLEQTRIASTGCGKTPYYDSPLQLESDLQGLLTQLKSDHQGLFAEQLEDLLTKVRIFGFHFAVLDLRQDSRIHHTVCTELVHALAQAGAIPTEHAVQWDTNESPVALISPLLEQPLTLDSLDLNSLSEITRETVESYRVVREIQQSNGTRAVHRSIISNTQSAANIFEVLLLIHLSGGTIADPTLDIVPLFETIDDLKHADTIMEELYSNSLYGTYLRKRGSVQHIMVGFSDGTKDGGYLGANLGIYQAKRRLTTVSRDANIRVVFFDGRGGPPARGGGNTHRFYRSLGKDVSHEQIHLTIQGQTISSNFGTLESARYNIEQIFTAGLESSLFHHEEGVLTPAESSLLETLAAGAHEKYRTLREDPLFVPYLEEMTPLRYYDRLNVGSRPVKRKGTLRSFSDLRAIPFVGSWSQIKQNVPGFYGLGTALEKMKSSPDQWHELKRLYQENLFFQTVMDNAMQSLAKTCFPLTASLAHHPRYGTFWKTLEEEANRTTTLLCEVAGIGYLLENEPVIRRSIEIREKIVLPLLVIQQYALERLQEADTDTEQHLSMEEEEILKKLVVKSLAANINASRNSA